MSGSPPPTGGFVRRIGLFQATAINMSQMCGIGPFVTIPLMVGAFGGPQAVIGFVAGAVLALADGLVWAELGASMPGSGGSYVYLRQAFQYRSGRLMPFLFVWTAMLFIPLIMSTGVVGFVQYLGYLAPHMGRTTGDLVGLAVIAVVIGLLWRGIEHIARITAVMWAVMIASVLLVIVAAATDFSGHLAFTYPAHAFALTSGHFWTGFAGGLTIGIYDYLGYNTTAYMGAEIKNPGRVLPRSIIYSILGIMAIYLMLQIGTLGVIDWHRMTDPHDIASTSVASAVLEKTWGKGAADTVTVLILVTAFASVFTGLLGGSRVPYDAARERVFFRPYARMHAAAPLPGVGAGHHGRHHRDRLPDRPAHRPPDADPAAHHGDGDRAGARADPRRRACCAAASRACAAPTGCGSTRCRACSPWSAGSSSTATRTRTRPAATPSNGRWPGSRSASSPSRCGRATRRCGRSGRGRSPRSTSTAPTRTRSRSRPDGGRGGGTALRVPTGRPGPPPYAGQAGDRRTAAALARLRAGSSTGRSAGERAPRGAA